MKLRNGFVSNSSSSSFIVGVPKDHSAKIKVKIETELSLVDPNFKEESILKDISQLDKFLDDHGINPKYQPYPGPKEYCEELVEKIKDQLEKGNHVIFGFMDNQAGVVERGLYFGGLKEFLPSEIELIDDCHGEN